MSQQVYAITDFRECQVFEYFKKHEKTSDKERRLGVSEVFKKRKQERQNSGIFY